MFFIVGDIPLKFFLPEGFIRFRGSGVFAAFVPMPETAVNKNHRLVFRQYDVRVNRSLRSLFAYANYLSLRFRAGQGFDVFPEAATRFVQHGADENLGFGICRAYARHVPRAFFWSQVIHGRIRP